MCDNCRIFNKGTQYERLADQLQQYAEPRIKIIPTDPPKPKASVSSSASSVSGVGAGAVAGSSAAGSVSASAGAGSSVSAVQPAQ